jgi:6-pyruvoyl-tetrahydropterin synthase
MFELTVRDRMMIAHSLSGDFFGPAQRLHGATYVVDARLRATDLDEHGVVADIGALAAALRAVLAGLEYRNLDDEADFAGVLTTTEALARIVADRLAERILQGETGVVDHVQGLEVVLHESDVASAGYRRDLR